MLELLVDGGGESSEFPGELIIPPAFPRDGAGEDDTGMPPGPVGVPPVLPRRAADRRLLESWEFDPAKSLSPMVYAGEETWHTHTLNRPPALCLCMCVCLCVCVCVCVCVCRLTKDELLLELLLQLVLCSYLGYTCVASQ